MRIRHLVAAENVDADGFVIDPLEVRHGLVVGARIAALAGPIDPASHLNLDFPGHRLDRCLVAKRLEVDAPVLLMDDGWLLAQTRPDAYAHRGSVDVHGRRAAWQQVSPARHGDIGDE
jgi:hypothetical protein